MPDSCKRQSTASSQYLPVLSGKVQGHRHRLNCKACMGQPAHQQPLDSSQATLTLSSLHRAGPSPESSVRRRPILIPALLHTHLAPVHLATLCPSGNPFWTSLIRLGFPSVISEMPYVDPTGLSSQYKFHLYFLSSSIDVYPTDREPHTRFCSAPYLLAEHKCLQDRRSNTCG